MGLVHGFTSGKELIPLLVDASGRPIVTLGPSTENIGKVEITAAPTLNVDVQNWPSDLHFSGGLLGRLGSDNLSAGTNQFSEAAVSAGHVWRLTHVGLIYVGTVASVVIIGLIIRGSTTIVFHDQKSITSGTWYFRDCDVPLIAGDVLRFRVEGATAGNDAFMDYAGYDMLVG